MPFYLKPGKHNQSKNPILNSVEDMNNPTEEEVASGNYARQFFKNEEDNIYNTDTKPLPKPGADEVIDINNIKSDIESGKVTQAGVAGGKFLTKQLIKEGLKKYAGPMIAKSFGVIGAMLNTNKAYGGQDTSITGGYERRLSAGGENVGDTKKFFDDQYKNFDSQTEFQQRRLKDLNEKYSLGYLQNDL
tara:strand:+ start:4905 stop:5471 length:567 start_codon:yes stop_codon:yes gene_type:complete